MTPSGRAAAFLVLCVGSRLLLVHLARSVVPRSPPRARYALVGLTATTAAAMLALYLFDLRPDAAEAGGAAWWNRLRPVHAALLALYAAYAARGHDAAAWPFLLADVALGVVAWAAHHRFLPLPLPLV